MSLMAILEMLTMIITTMRMTVMIKLRVMIMIMIMIMMMMMTGMKLLFLHI